MLFKKILFLLTYAARIGDSVLWHAIANCNKNNPAKGDFYNGRLVEVGDQGNV
jgi:hypothetical protein